MDRIIERIHDAIKRAGYEYAKSYYAGWHEEFKDEIEDSSSYYYHSVDEKGHPFEEIFSEQTFIPFCSNSFFFFFTLTNIE